MSADNLTPKDVYVESTSDCILINEHCYIKSPSETGPMTHSPEGFLELENCFDCESSSKRPNRSVYFIDQHQYLHHPQEFF